MANYTLQINVGTTAPLDGVTPLNLSAPGVTVDLTSNRTLQVNLDGALFPALGRIDPGEIAENMIPSLAGKAMLMTSFTAVSAGGVYPVTGNELRLITPAQLPGPVEGTFIIRNLGEVPFAPGIPVVGQVFDRKTIFPYRHLMGFETTVGGPHVLVIVLRPLTDGDVASCCFPTPPPPAPGPPPPPP